MQFGSQIQTALTRNSIWWKQVLKGEVSLYFFQIELFWFIEWINCCKFLVRIIAVAKDNSTWRIMFSCKFIGPSRSFKKRSKMLNACNILFCKLRNIYAWDYTWPFRRWNTILPWKKNSLLQFSWKTQTKMRWMQRTHLVCCNETTVKNFFKFGSGQILWSQVPQNLGTHV